MRKWKRKECKASKQVGEHHKTSTENDKSCQRELVIDCTLDMSDLVDSWVGAINFLFSLFRLGCKKSFQF